ncbi:two-component regulator propeller domain-containing protein [Terriglobus sp. 2YAB30_2]|uniref:sensor histidine kinase n=1 Tax=Terriglobus sp. 2YAB30_2 TaxID=3233023 RepID=UPI003F9B099C
MKLPHSLQLRLPAGRWHGELRSWLCLAMLFFCIPLYGIDRDRTLAQLHHTGWTYIEGAPGQVRALAQTTDGYLWLGTATGLFRYDGIQFQAYKPQSGRAFPQRNIVSLFATPDGGLWVGYWYGGVSFIKDGRVTDYGKPDGLPSSQVLAFARDRQGVIWIAAGKDGLVRLEGSRWKKIGPDTGFSGPANTVFVNRAGTVWVGTPTSVVYLVEGESRFQTAAQGLLRVRNFAESSDGTLWMAETGYGVRPVPLPGRDSGKRGPAVLVGSQAIAFDQQGSLWITSLGNGIRRVPYPERLHPPKIEGPSAWRFHDPEVEEFTPQDGLTSDYVSCLLEDHEGNLWIGTSGGLDRFRQSPVVSVTVQPVANRGALPIPSLQSFTTNALAAGEQGALWAAGIGPQVLVKIQNDKIATQLRDRYVDCVYRDPNGAVWLATPWSIFRLSSEHETGSTREVVTYNYAAAVPAGQGQTLRRLNLPVTNRIAVNVQSRVKAMTQDQSGRLWVSMDTGTFRLERSAWTSLESLGGPRGTATAEFTDSQGRIWFGFANTIAMLDRDGVRTFSRKDGIQVGTITSIQGKGSKIWIGGEFGLEFWEGSRFQPVSPADGSAFSGVSGILANSDDGLWFTEQRGVIHIREAQLQQLSSGKVEFESFGLLDGFTAALRGSLASPSAAQTTDGHLWFATTKGLAWIDPKRVTRNDVPPPVLVESVLANNRKYDTSTFFRLPPRTRNLQIVYTATSLTIPERVRFRYKLEGQDKDWQDAGTRREAFYTNLDPGSYRFRVIACNNDGVWNEAGSTLSFVVLPAFDQTLWFRLLCVAVLAGCLWLLYLLRLKQVTAHVRERLGARLEERARIARELHDTLLQGFQGLLLRFDAVKKAIPQDHPARNQMESVLDRADEVLHEGRERVRDLRHDEISANELPDKLAASGEELRKDHEISFSLSVIGTPQPLDATVGDEVIRIGQEALANAFRHSSSSKIEVEITYDPSRVRLRVRDDGVGMSQDVLIRGRDGHWGIVGMRERTQKIGGQLKIWSQESAGTEIELTIPAAIAYPFSHKAERWHWIKRLLGPGG